MTAIRRVDGELWMEGVRLAEVAGRFGTPSYVYSRAAIETAWRAFDDALAGTDHLVCYAVKANSNLAVLGVLARLGAGFDIVSGESSRGCWLPADGRTGSSSRRGQERGGDPRRALGPDTLLQRRKRTGARAPGRRRGCHGRSRAGVAAREPRRRRAHPPYISTGLKGNKFGIAHDRALAAYDLAARLPNLQVTGIDCHIGSQILDMAPLEEALERVLELAAAVVARGIPIRHVDLGGGLGIRYREEETALDIGRWCRAVAARLAGSGYSLVLEPGRAIVGNAGVLLSRVEYLKLDKGKRFAVVDASMSELIRPALYEAWHEITPLAALDRPVATYDVVGPVCESSDVLGTDRRLAIAPGDGIAILSAAPTAW